MKILFALFTTFLFAGQTSATSIPSSTLHSSIEKVETGPDNLTFIASLKIKEVEKLIGRKLKLKEKINFKIAQWKIKNDIEKDEGKTAQTLGILGAASLFIPVLNLAAIPLAILAIVTGNKAKRKDPTNRKARTGVTLGIVTLAFIVTIGLIVALVLTIGQFPM